MKPKEQKEIIAQIVKKYGDEKQIEQAIEEMSELIQALCKHKRGRPHNITEEIADVKIMLQQLELIFPITEIKYWEELKLNRMKLRISA
jgi:NTP pyrophosphatase (non-canonical NTP hydrolase)